MIETCCFVRNLYHLTASWMRDIFLDFCLLLFMVIHIYVRIDGLILLLFSTNSVFLETLQLQILHIKKKILFLLSVFPATNREVTSDHCKNCYVC